jgi:hypothetical protein
MGTAAAPTFERIGGKYASECRRDWLSSSGCATSPPCSPSSPLSGTSRVRGGVSAEEPATQFSRSSYFIPFPPRSGRSMGVRKGPASNCGRRARMRRTRAGGLHGTGSRQAGAGSAINAGPCPTGSRQSPKPNPLWGSRTSSCRSKPAGSKEAKPR